MTKKIIEKNLINIRFAGDSGDGMQLTGTLFTNMAAIVGNDVKTYPDYPAEIRAPAGTPAGVSGFQLTFADHPIHTTEDQLDVLVAMNPAALKIHQNDLKKNGLLIVNEDNFQEREWKKAGYQSNPLESESLQFFSSLRLPLTELTIKAVKEHGLSHSQAKKCKNMFSLGVICYLFDRTLDYPLEWLTKKFTKQADILKANQAALTAGFNYADTVELFAERYQVEQAKLTPGTYRQLTGNQAIALACATVAVKTQRPLLVAGYPITPASEILQLSAQYQHLNIRTFQAEDEIAAVCAAIGASYGGGLGMTCTSGPGMDLKAEGIGLAVMTELPLVVIDVQRSGPSTGMPTKMEQSDLLTALYGRHGECPVAVIAAQSPSDCFYTLLEAWQIAIKYMTPVIMLSDGYLANGAEPWLLPDEEVLPEFFVNHPEEENFQPYQRDPQTLARPWISPGTPNLEHRIGGLEKQHLSGHVSYDPLNHQQMVDLRAQKIRVIQNDIPDAEISTTKSGKKKNKLLIISWGSTRGTVQSAIESLDNYPIASLHLRHLNPLPKNLKTICDKYEKILIPELNSGQLFRLLRSELLIDAIPLSKVSGKPFLIRELREAILRIIG